MGVTIVALVIAAIAWKAPVRWGRRGCAVAILVLVAALAIVGRGSAGSPPPAVVLSNLLGGLALLATCVGLAAAARARHGRPSVPLAAASALLLAAIATGGVLSAMPSTDAMALGLVHKAASWASVLAWVLLAIGSSLTSDARFAARLTAVLLAAQVLLALVAAGWPAEGWPAARWMHNLLSAAALCSAFAGVWAPATGVRGASAVPERIATGS